MKMGRVTGIATKHDDRRYCFARSPARAKAYKETDKHVRHAEACRVSKWDNVVLATKLWASFKVLLLLTYVSNDLEYVTRIRDILWTSETDDNAGASDQ